MKLKSQKENLLSNSKKSDSDGLDYKAIEKTTNILNNYDEIVNAIFTSKQLETSDFEDIYSKSLKLLADAKSIRDMITKMTENDTWIPGFDQASQSLIYSLKSLNVMLLGLKNKSRNPLKYSILAYKRDLKDFKIKHKNLDDMRVLFMKNFSDYEYSEDEYEAAEKRYRALMKGPEDQKTSDSTYNDIALHYWKYSVADYEKYKTDIITILWTQTRVKPKVNDSEVLLCAFLARWSLELYDNMSWNDALRVVNYLCTTVASVYKVNTEMLLDNVTNIIDGIITTVNKQSESGLDKNTLIDMATSAWIVNNASKKFNQTAYDKITELLLDSR